MEHQVRRVNLYMFEWITVMLNIYRLLLFYTIAVHGSSSQKISLFIDCLAHCNDSCKLDCGPLYKDTDIISQVQVNANANINLHCTDEHEMMIKFNSGAYIIEQSISAYSWSFAKVVTGSWAAFTNLTESTGYRFRLHRLTKEGVSLPEISKWFSTLGVDYKPLKVQNISLLKYSAMEEDECSLDAEVAFEPAEDRVCTYTALTWNKEHSLYHQVIPMQSHFQFKIFNLNFGETLDVKIFPGIEDKSNGSAEASLTFVTPTCLEFYSDLSICAPDEVKELQVEHIHRFKNVYDIKVNWSKPLYEPSNYSIEIDLLNGNLTYLECVSGNATEISFLNIELGPQYIVSILAESVGGTSDVVSVFKELTIVNDTYRDVIIGIIILITVVVLIGLICMLYCRQKNKKFNGEYMDFELLNQKDLSIETIKKIFSQDSNVDDKNASVIHDKFELSPELLKLKCILGSGAYGIVRLGSLQDESGNAIDVAVKMLKDNPCVEDVQNFHQEILIMKFTGKHPNIVSLIGYSILHNKPVLVVEYCSKGDLQSYLRTIWKNMVSVAFNHRARLKLDADLFSDNGSGKEHNYQNVHMNTNPLYGIQQDVECTEIITPNDLLNFARQISIGMEFLSSNRIVHRDLAARNVLVCPERIVKISDFGLSRDIYQENLYKKQGNGKLPLKWMAVESLTHQVYTVHSDVWSFGILLWEIVTMSAIPYPGIPTNKILKLLKSGYRMERPANCSIELYNIMFSCWHVRPQSRPTFTQLKKSLDSLLSSYSENKYLNIEETLYDSRIQCDIEE